MDGLPGSPPLPAGPPRPGCGSVGCGSAGCGSAGCGSAGCGSAGCGVRGSIGPASSRPSSPGEVRRHQDVLGAHVGGAQRARELQALQQRELGRVGQRGPVGQQGTGHAGRAAGLGEQGVRVGADPADLGLLGRELEHGPEQMLGVEVGHADAGRRRLHGPAGGRRAGGGGPAGGRRPGGGGRRRAAADRTSRGVRAQEAGDVDPGGGPSWLGRREEEAGEPDRSAAGTSV
ncbi:hypothetical protein [Actinoplanes nipponensis]|uniref:hypothetical protein n=1 Tax=Actinoplanes nipponensis TaxID=135950 RepID=UPI0031ECEB56